MNDKSLDRIEIMKLLPHRDPFLHIDRIVDYELGESIIAEKIIKPSEPYFEGHFPRQPIVPGVIIIEAMAQAGGVLGHLTVGDIKPKPIYYLVGVEKARFRFPIYPGDTIKFDVKVDRVNTRITKAGKHASVKLAEGYDAEETSLKLGAF